MQLVNFKSLRKFSILLFLIVLSCTNVEDEPKIDEIREANVPLEAIRDVARFVNTKTGIDYDGLNKVLNEKYEIDFYKDFYQQSEKANFARMFTNYGNSNSSSRTFSESTEININEAINNLKFTDYSTIYLGKIYDILPENEEEAPEDLDGVYARIEKLRNEIVDDSYLTNIEKQDFLLLLDTYQVSFESVLEIVAIQIGEDPSSARTNGFWKKFKNAVKTVWRGVRSVVVSTAVFAGAGFLAGGPVGAIIGGVAALIGSSLDLALNNRCHFAMQCSNGWVQDCNTGECLSRNSGGSGAGNGGVIVVDQLVGPTSVGGVKSNSSCRGCGGDNYNNTVDNVEINPITIQDGTEPPFNVRGAVDMSKAPAGSFTNELGWPRNKDYFWAEYSDPFNGLTQRNKQLISDGFSPTVDDQWRTNVPGELSAKNGEVIEHHHVNKGRYAIPRAKSLHREGVWYSRLHPKFTNATVFKKGTDIFGRTGKTMIGSLSLFLNAYSLIRSGFSQDPQEMTNTIYGYIDGGIINEPFNKFQKNRLYLIQSEYVYFEINDISRDTSGRVIYLEWTIYENFGFDGDENRYIGVGIRAEGIIGGRN